MIKNWTELIFQANRNRLRKQTVLFFCFKVQIINDWPDRTGLYWTVRVDFFFRLLLDFESVLIKFSRQFNSDESKKDLCWPIDRCCWPLTDQFLLSTMRCYSRTHWTMHKAQINQIDQVPACLLVKPYRPPKLHVRTLVFPFNLTFV